MRVNRGDLKPFVSVVIPVFNDRVRIATCLAAVSRQSYPRDRYEVIVVDNGSTDGTTAVVDQHPAVRLVSEGRRGSYAARNTGLAVAVGDIVAFTDSDCIPDAAWLAEGVRCLEADPGVGLVAGRVDVYLQAPARCSLAELYEFCFAFPQEEYVRRDRFGATANVFTRATVLRDVGVFDGSLESGGDRQWGRRVAAGGWGLVYCGAASVRHPARREWADLEEKVCRVYDGLRAQGVPIHSWSRRTIPLLRIPADIYHILKSRTLKTRWKPKAILALVRMRFFQQRLRLQRSPA